MRRTHYLLRLFPFLMAMILIPLPIRATSDQPTVWGTEQAVSVLAAADSSLYVGGSFYTLAPVYNAFVALDAQTGALDSALPPLDGSITVLVADGLGGWYIGCLIEYISSIRSQLLHIRADKTLDPTWHPQFDGYIHVLNLAGNTLYVGGNFATIDGQPHSALAAIDATTGAPIDWDPQIECYSYRCVDSLAVIANTLYIGGDFTSFAGQPRMRLAAINTASRILTSWQPNADGRVRALVASGNTVYVGGGFQQIGGQTRPYLAALDATTGALTTWNPHPDGEVDVLAFGGNTIWVGGGFGTIGGQNRSYIAELDTTIGNATAWSYDSSKWPYVCEAASLLVAGNTVYVGCASTIIALNRTTGLLTPWTANARVSGTVSTLVSSGGVIYAGGSISIGAVSHFSLAAINTTTGVPRAWKPGVVDPIYPTALATTGKVVYIGGQDPNAGPHSLNHMISALDTADTPNAMWRIQSDGVPLAIVVSGNTVYVGGFFTMIGGQIRNHLAALDSATGVVTQWNLNVEDPVEPTVFALALSGNTLYIGGQFTSIGGQARNNLAAVDVRTGQLTGWNPVANAPVNSLAIARNSIYAGGAFTTVGGQTHSHLAAIDDIGVPIAWNPDVNNTITSIAASNSIVYIGGDFTSVNGQPRQRLAAVDIITGAALDWDVDANDTVAALALLGDSIYIGGKFTKLGSQFASHLAQRFAPQIDRSNLTQHAQLPLIIH